MIARQKAPESVSETITKKGATETATVYRTKYKTAYERFIHELPGEWHLATDEETDEGLRLIIKPDLSFEAIVTGTGKDSALAGTYKGKIVPQWTDSDARVDMPEMLSFDLINPPGEYMGGGDFMLSYLLHETHRIMLLTETSMSTNMFSRFDLYENGMFELYQESGELPLGKIRKDDTFFAAFWGIDNEKGVIWLEHINIDDFSGVYTSESNESLRYNLAENVSFYIGGNEFYYSAVYQVTTNTKGEVTIMEIPGDPEAPADEDDFNTVINPRFEYSIKIPAHWNAVDTSENGDGFLLGDLDDDIEIRVYGSYDVDVIGIDAVYEILEEEYPQIQDFYSNGSAGYRAENDGEILFKLYDSEKSVTFRVDYSADKHWYDENKELIERIAGTMSFFAGPEKYHAFMDSKDWAVYKDDFGAHHLPELFPTNYTIFDFDNNGVEELWLEGYNYSGMSPYGISGFYTIEAGSVVTLLSLYLSDGSVGGEWLGMYYDTTTNRHVVGVSGHAGGFGGTASWNKYYDYINGTLTLITELTATDMDDEITYEINGEEASKENYERLSDRFTEPKDPKYELPKG